MRPPSPAGYSQTMSTNLKNRNAENVNHLAAIDARRRDAEARRAAALRNVLEIEKHNHGSHPQITSSVQDAIANAKILDVPIPAPIKNDPAFRHAVLRSQIANADIELAGIQREESTLREMMSRDLIAEHQAEWNATVRDVCLAVLALGAAIAKLTALRGRISQYSPMAVVLQGWGFDPLQMHIRGSRAERFLTECVAFKFITQKDLDNARR